MNRFTSFTLALLALSGSTAALADDPTLADPVAATSVVSRAAVQEAALQARAAGLNPGGEAAHGQPAAGMALARAQVVAETLEAIRIGAVEHGEQSRVLTPMQLERIHMAGQRALSTTTAGL